MKIAVVVLNWNGKKLLEQFIPRLIKYSGQAELYVADNASSDESILLLKTSYPEINILINKKNYGFAEGYNKALHNLDADIFALVNSDVEVTQDWLIPILETFKNEPKTAIIQPKILDFKNKSHFEYAGAAGGFIDKFGYPYCRGRIFDTVEKDSNQYDDTSEIFWASGACFFIRKSVFELLDGFDEDFFAHQEEIDLCWRSFNLGFVTKYNSKSVIYHVGGATLDKSNPRKTYLNFRNSLLMLIKNLPLNSLIPILLIRLLLDGLAAIQFITKGKFLHFFAILKAHLWFYILFFKNFRKRKCIQKRNYFNQKSIVYTYFIKKKVVFEN